MVLINKLFSKISKRVFLYPLAAAFFCSVMFTGCNDPNIDDNAEKIIKKEYRAALDDCGYSMKLIQAKYVQKNFDEKEKMYIYGFAFKNFSEDFFVQSCLFLSELLNNIDENSELFIEGFRVQVFSDIIYGSYGSRPSEMIVSAETKSDENSEILTIYIETQYRYYEVKDYIPTYEDYKLLSESFADYEISVNCKIGNYKISEIEKSEFQRIAEDFENIEFVGYEN